LSMKSKKPEILYSDPVQDIISNPPRKIIRWGTTVIFAVFASLLLLSWLIRYPDLIPAQVEITTTNPPVTLVTKITGKINKLYVTDGQNVSAGDLLAVMETAASVSDIQLLDSVTETIRQPESLSSRSFPGFSELGELQIHHATFIKALSDYDTYIKNDFYGSKIKSLEEELIGIGEYIERLRTKEDLLSENVRLERRKFGRDSLLFADEVLPESNLELSEQSLIRISLELQQVKLDLSAKRIELAVKKQLLQDNLIMRQGEKEKLVTLINEAFVNLKAQISIWKNRYLLFTPVTGTVTFTKFWSENQSVVEGESVLTVVPSDAGEFIGRTSLGMLRSGKVKPDMAVNIKLSGFPYLEYGMVRGVVKTKSLVSSGNAYIIEISLPDGLTTRYGNKLEFTQNMQGTAEIITENIRLLQKIINPFRYMITKNRQSLPEK
jgi:hypothetical protein